MTAAREAAYLPLTFLTVALLGGIRIAGRVLLLPPSLFSLVLGLMLLGVLVKSGALAPERLMNARRSGLANTSGVTVLVTLFFASAQAFNLVTPESGLPHFLVCVFLLTLLLNTLAAGADRVRTLRSLLVVFGSAFILKFIVLAALSDQTGGPPAARDAGAARRRDAGNAHSRRAPSGHRLPRVLHAGAVSWGPRDAAVNGGCRKRKGAEESSAPLRTVRLKADTTKTGYSTRGAAGPRRRKTFVGSAFASTRMPMKPTFISSQLCGP